MKRKGSNDQQQDSESIQLSNTMINKHKLDKGFQEENSMVTNYLHSKPNMQLKPSPELSTLTFSYIPLCSMWSMISWKATNLAKASKKVPYKTGTKMIKPRGNEHRKVITITILSHLFFQKKLKRQLRRNIFLHSVQAKE